MGTTTLLLAALMTSADAKQPPAKIELFAKTDWYQQQAGQEQTFEGLLKDISPRDDIVGFGRTQYFVLKMGKGTPPDRFVYVGGKPELLKAYADRRVRIVGKAVTFEKLEGRDYHEIWPARLEVVPANTIDEVPRNRANDKDIKADASLIAPLAVLERPLVEGTHAISSEDELAQRIGKNSVKETLAKLAKEMKIDAIDFRQHTLINISDGPKPSGGYDVIVRLVPGKNGSVEVHYVIAPSDGPATAEITHPGRILLIAKPKGEVDFSKLKIERAAPRPKENKTPRQPQRVPTGPLPIPQVPPVDPKQPL